MIVAGIVASLFFAAAIEAIFNTTAENYYVTQVEQATVQRDFVPETAKTLAVKLHESTSKTQDIEEQETLIKSRDWSAVDAEILLKIAMAEAEGESTEGKALVMLVVLNRVWSDGFPNSIENVVFQQHGDTYQFSPVAPGGRYWTTEPNEDCYQALDMISHGWDESQGALYFEACEGESWHSRNLEYLFTEGGNRFYK